jgi:uncharacterized membrane protein YdjX (TVP38/TMEM64 family)
MIAGLTLTRSIAVGVLITAAALAVLIYYDAQAQLLELLEWFEAQGLWALLLFTLLMAAVVVLLLPGVMFTTGAGFVFGVAKGTLCVVLGTTLGATLAFLIARYWFGARSAQFIVSHTKLKLFSDELTPQGWKIIMLSRLVPFFPFKLSNYFFGLTHFSLRHFVFGTLIGIIPFSLHNVYLGSIVGDIATLGTRNQHRTPLEWGVYGVGFLALVAIVLYLNRLARRVLAKYTGDDAQEAARCHG